MSLTATVGDRFHRPLEPSPIYRVLRMMEFDHHRPHVMLVAENPDRRTITIGVEVLFDRRQWLPLA